MIVKLPLGNDTRAVDLREFRVRPLAPSAPRGRLDCRALVNRALDHPEGGRSLEERAADCRSAAVVVPDQTRPAALAQVLPLVLGRLLAAGIPTDGITVLVANGTHPPVSQEDLAAIVGQLPAGVHVVQHRCRTRTDLTFVGELESGLRVRLNRVAVDADVVVTIGAVRHHYFAGFGGGGKLIFPGVAGYDEIQVNHSRVLERDATGKLKRHPGCEPGILVGNPVAEEIAAAVELQPPDFSLCLIPGSDGRIAHAIGGSWRAAFEAAVDRVREWYEVSSVPRSRLAVASAGGDPTDATLIQAHKALDAVCRFVEADGEVLFFADLGGGSGSPDMESFLRDPRPEEIMRRLRDRWVQYGHTTLRIVEKTSRYRVYLVSQLDPTVAARLGFHAVADAAEVTARWRERYSGTTVTVLPGPAVYLKQSQM